MTETRSHSAPTFFVQQSPILVFLEIIFALLLLVAFWVNREHLIPSAVSPLPTPVAGQAAPDVGAVVNLAAPAGEANTALSCRQLLLNGDFEQASDWQIPITAQQAAYTDRRASSRQRSLRLGIVAEGTNVHSDSTASQWVRLPAEAARLTLRAKIWRSSDGDPNDFQYLQVTAGDRTQALFRDSFNDPHWETVTFDLMAFRGERVRLLFGVFNDGDNGKAAMFVDSVEVESCSAQQRIGLPLVVDSLGEGPATPVPPLYLPVLLKDYAFFGPEPTSTPTPTPTATAVPDLCTEEVVNGGFEADTAWTIPLTARPARYSSDQVWSGRQSLRLGIPTGTGNANSDSTAYQWIDLPADAEQITLRAQVWRASSGADRDFHYLWVTSGGVTTRVFQQRFDGQRWENVEFDLTNLRGRRVRLLFGTYNDGWGGTAVMYVDGVSIESCAPGAVPSTPTPTPTAQPTSQPHATPPSIASPDFGANAFLWWRPEIAQRDLELMDEAGFRWVRQSFAWEDIEPAAKGEFIWENADRVVQDVNESGLYLLARLGSDPDLTGFWAGGPPDNADDFADFAYAVASRYDCTADAIGCIQAYQIWNEPNLAREWGGNRPNPAQYVTFLGKAYAAIKRANPNAIVINAGMAPTGTDNEIAMPDDKFYREMYQALDGDSDNYFDMLGIHAAGFAAPPELDPAEAAANPDYGGFRFFSFRHAEDIRQIMEDNGDGDKRVAILEFGWTSDPVNPPYIWHGAGAGIDEFVKSDYLVRAYRYAAEHWQSWIGIMSLLTMPNLDWLNDGNPQDEEQYWWAIMEPSQIDELRLRPAFVELCVYFNSLDEQTCPYDPSQ